MRNEAPRESEQLDTCDRAEWRWRVISLIVLLGCIGLSLWGYRSGILQSSEKLQAFVKRFGYMGGILFIIVQIVQVIVPILPGGISCLGGVLLFGPWLGFLYNYIGICIGSLGAFGIAKSLGSPVLEKIFSKKQIEKYKAWTKKDERFLKFFAAAIFFPMAPDDFLCYLAGTTKMTWKQFALVIFLGKPGSILLYSIGLTTVFRFFFPSW